jgi:hypothetical protein
MKAIPLPVPQLLDRPYELSAEQISFYHHNRCIKLKHVLDDVTLTYYNDVITDCVNRLNTQTKEMKERSTYQQAFLQLFNLWREDEQIKKLVFSKRLAQLAASLLQCSGSRLYHDQALFKEPGGGITPWLLDHF